MEDKYPSNEEAYARQFYSRLNDVEYITPLLGGRYPCSVNKNQVAFNGLGVNARFLFKEHIPKIPDCPRTLNLTLEMSLEKEPGLEVIVETSKILDNKSKDGILSDRCIDLIIKGFFIPGLKDFDRMIKNKKLSSE